MNSIPLGALFGALVFLIILSAFFSASEISMMALNRYRLRHLVESGNRGARLVNQLLEHPDRLLGIILLGNNAVNILASSVATIIAIRLYGEVAIAAAAALLTLLILVFAEVAPKTLAATRPERIAFPAAYVLHGLLRLLYYPMVWPVNVLSNLLLKLLGVTVQKSTAELSSEELRAAVVEAGALIPESHQSMLLGILDLEKLTVEDVMIPRSQIAGINLDGDWDAIVEQISNTRYTRLPVYSGNLDNMIGMVHVRKIIHLMRHGTMDRTAFEKILLEPYFIPEGTPLTTQLINFRSSKRRRGLVVDEYGDIMGLVTLEEILEEIVGDFTSQALGNLEDMQPQEDGSYLIKGGASIRDINRKLGWSLPSKKSRTLNGLIVEYLENLPAVGTSLMLDGYMVEIVRTRGTAVQIARVRPNGNVETTEAKS